MKNKYGFEVGDIAEVIAMGGGHRFKIGQKVKLRKDTGDDIPYWKAVDSKEVWCLNYSSVKKIESDPIEAQRAKVAKHQAKLDLMIQEKAARDIQNSKVELKGGDWFTGCGRTGSYRGDSKACTQYGIKRQTKELAESARKEIIRLQRALAYADENCEMGVLRDTSVYFDVDDEKWETTFERNAFIQPMMTTKCAKQLADDLNSGRFSLDLE